MTDPNSSDVISSGGTTSPSEASSSYGDSPATRIEYYPDVKTSGGPTTASSEASSNDIEPHPAS